MVILKTKLELYYASDPEWEEKLFVLIPDLCVEIVSKNDRYNDVIARVQRYLDDGVRLVWVVSLAAKTVSVYRLDDPRPTVLRRGDVLLGEDVLPGFELAVSSVFA
jgi:Uma2 family endonuclease